MTGVEEAAVIAPMLEAAAAPEVGAALAPIAMDATGSALGSAAAELGGGMLGEAGWAGAADALGLTGEQMTSAVAQAALDGGIGDTGGALISEEALKDTAGNAAQTLTDPQVNQALDTAHSQTLSEYGNPANLSGQEQMAAIKEATPWHDQLAYGAQGMMNNLSNPLAQQGLKGASSAMQAMNPKGQGQIMPRQQIGDMGAGASGGKQSSSFQTFSPYKAQGTNAGFNPQQMQMAEMMKKKQAAQFDPYQQMQMRSLLG